MTSTSTTTAAGEDREASSSTTAATANGSGSDAQPSATANGSHGGGDGGTQQPTAIKHVTFEPLEVEDAGHPRPSQRQTLLDENGNGFTSRGGALHVQQNRRGHRRNHHPVDQMWSIVKLYMELHPYKATVVVFVLVGFVLHLMVDRYHRSRYGMLRHSLHHDYSHIDTKYNFRASQLENWCLFGTDEDCACEDFVDPVDRAESKPGWTATHRANLELINEGSTATFGDVYYDVIFLGDETTEIWNGRLLNLPVGKGNRRSIPDGHAISEWFNNTFGKSKDDDKGQRERENHQFNGLALGIAGDSVRPFLFASNRKRCVLFDFLTQQR